MVAADKNKLIFTTQEVITCNKTDTVNRSQTIYHNTSIKVTVKFSLEQAMKAQRGSRGISLLFL
jgi:hypothetical protein